MTNDIEDIAELTPDEINDLYQKVFAVSIKLINSGEKPLNLASVLLAQSMRLYRTCLTEEDFLLMVEAITDSAKDVTAYDLDNLDNLTFDSTTIH